MEPINNFFTATSIGTFAGATAAVWVFSNVFRILFGRDSISISLIVALIVAFMGAYATNTLNDIVGYFLAILNGCLLFLTAAGVQGFAKNAAQGQPEDMPKLQGRGKIKFLTPWFK